MKLSQNPSNMINFPQKADKNDKISTKIRRIRQILPVINFTYLQSNLKSLLRTFRAREEYNLRNLNILDPHYMEHRNNDRNRARWDGNVPRDQDAIYQSQTSNISFLLLNRQW